MHRRVAGIGGIDFERDDPDTRSALSIGLDCIGGVGFGSDRKPGMQSALDIGLDGLPSLNPGISVDPKVNVVAGESFGNSAAGEDGMMHRRSALE